MLTFDSIASILLVRGLIDVSEIIDSELTIQSALRRNCNFRVERTGRCGFFLKQSYETDEAAQQSLRRESTFNRFCAVEPAVFEISQLLPRLVSENGDQNILIFDLISPAFTVGSILDRESDSGSFVQAMRALGAALATVHRALSLRQWGEDARLASIPRSIPWAMTLHKPAIAMLAKITQADWKALWFLQNQGEIAAQLERLGGQWQPEALIHGDIRLDNILVTSRTDGTDQSSIRLWIVDWEMVQFGDPAWDVAGALQDLVVHWVKTMPMSDELNAEERTSRATFPLAVLQRAARAIWSGYRSEARLGAEQAEELARRAVAFSAARMIQSALEAAAGADRLPGPAVLLLQISENLLADPARVQAELYGIPSGSLVP